MTSSALTLALFSLSAAPALAAGGNCPSAPQNYDTAACNNRCIRDGAGTMICDITAQPGNNVVVVVKDYRPFVMIGSSRYSAWGTANGANFCCALDSSTASPINGVRVLTGSGVDEVWFTAVHADGSEKN